MPTTLITVVVKPSFSRGKLVRLVSKDAIEGYYLSCWSLPKYFWLDDEWQQFEDYQAPNWKREISTDEVEQILQALAYQTISVVPEAIEVEVRDGSTYEFIWEDGRRKLSLSWHEEVPDNWNAVRTIVERLLEIAGSSA